MEETQTLKTAVVAIIGRPSAGKSTFLNTACQEPVSIVSPIPQTTRNAIKGIVNTSLGQLIFIDTPGYHDSEKKLNQKLRNVTESQLDGIDCALYVIDATRPTGEEEVHTAALLKGLQNKTVVAINKIDSPQAKPFPVRQFISENLPEISAQRILEMSAQKDTGINEVLKALYDISPQGTPIYDEETYTAGSFAYTPNNAESGYDGGGSLEISYIGNSVIDLAESYRLIKLEVIAVMDERGEITPYHRYQHTYGTLNAKGGKAKFTFSKDDRLEMTFPALIWNAANNKGNS